MTTKEIKMISEDDGHKLLGLFTLASDYYAKFNEVEKAICRTMTSLGAPDTSENYAGHVSDAIASFATTSEFFIALEKEGLVVDRKEPAP